MSIRMIAAVAIALLGVAGCSVSDSTKPASAEPASAKPATALPAAALPAAAKTTRSSIDPVAAKQLIASGAVVIDVRTPGEFADGHVAKAVNIPVGDLASRLGEVDALVASDKSKPVVVYCRTGRRSAMAKTALEAAGYGYVVNGGGFDALQ